MGFWSPAVLVNDARRHGIPALPVHLERSQATCSLEGEGIRLGFNQVQGMGEAVTARLLEARDAQPFADLADLCRRAGLSKRLVEHLVMAGALDDWQVPRRQLLWQLGKLDCAAGGLALDIAEEVILPELSLPEQLQLERALLGVSTRTHPLALYRAWLTRHGYVDSAAVKEGQNGEYVRVAGLLVVHQAPPTANGVHFLTLEDECGLVDVIVWPKVYQRYREVIRGAGVLFVAGKLQCEGAVMNVVVQHINDVRGYT